MAEEKTTGIILRTRLLTETSLIVHWLTPDVGRIATVAKGARRQKSTFRGKLDLFYEADFSFSRSARSELHNLREVVLKTSHPALREDMTKLQQAAYAAALIEQTTETETPVPEVFELMQSFLRTLDAHAATPALVFALELKTLELLGLAPELEEINLPAPAQQAARLLVESEFEEASSLDLPHAISEELRRFLHGFLIYHLGKVPKQRP